MNDINNRIRHFLSTAPRYKFVVVTDRSLMKEITTIDLGFTLASFLKENNKISREMISYVIQDELRSIISHNTYEHPEFGKLVCISNVGILFEDELNINVLQTFQRISRNTLIILFWDGEIKRNILFFLSENSQYKINLLEI